MVPFEVLPPRSSRLRVGAIVSLVLHGLVILPFLIPVPSDGEAETPVDQQVVYLVPPDKEGGRVAAGDDVDWSGAVGDRGATDEPLPKKVEPPEVTLPVGTEGDPQPSDELTAGPPVITESALSEVEVDSVVERDPTSVAPQYPPFLLARNIEGNTFVHYVVDTTGRVDTLTIQVVRATHRQFAASVREALALMKFRPAIQSSRKVRQWVEQSFSFRIVPPSKARSDTT